ADPLPAQQNNQDDPLGNSSTRDVDVSLLREVEGLLDANRSRIEEILDESKGDLNDGQGWGLKDGVVVRKPQQYVQTATSKATTSSIVTNRQ
ncbi:unnamed protein product, partial [Amoebophrya sp. A25]